MFGSLRPPLFERVLARLSLGQGFLHGQSSLLERRLTCQIEGPFHYRRLFLQDAQLLECLFFLLLVRLRFS